MNENRIKKCLEFQWEIKRSEGYIVTGIQLGIVKSVIGMNMDDSKDKLYSQGNFEANLNRNTLRKDSFIKHFPRLLLLEKNFQHFECNEL